MKRTPLKRKSATKKQRVTGATRCCYTYITKGKEAHCSRIGRVIVSPTERYCGTHATWIADKLVGDTVRERDGRCMFADVNAEPCFEPQTLYWCHIYRKGTYPSMRYRLDNAVAACSRHHYVFDNFEAEREEWMERRFTPLQRASLRGGRLMPGPKAADVIREYRGVAA